MTDEEIHNIYLHMSGKAEGLVEATGKADFPVLFARAILEYSKNHIGFMDSKLNPIKRSWVGLSNGEMIELSEMPLGSWDLILEVEAKLKERNL
jgi:hypothetical protein